MSNQFLAVIKIRFLPILIAAFASCNAVQAQPCDYYTEYGTGGNPDKALFMTIRTSCTLVPSENGPKEVCTNRRENMRCLLANGANPNAVLQFQTPLMHAASMLEVESARILIEYGADVNAKRTTDGRTPLMLAAAKQDITPHPGNIEISKRFIPATDMLRLLIEKGAEVNARDFGGQTALYHARVTAGNKKSQQFLKSVGGVE